MWGVARWRCEYVAPCNRPKHDISGTREQTNASFKNIRCRHLNYKYIASICSIVSTQAESHKSFRTSECSCLLLFAEFNEYLIIIIYCLNTSNLVHIIIFSKMFHFGYIACVICYHSMCIKTDYYNKRFIKK